MNHDRRDWVAVILAIGIATAINLITLAVLYDAIFSEGPGLSDNAVQVLSLAFGGILGVLGGYIGGRALAHKVEDDRSAPDTPPEP